MTQQVPPGYFQPGPDTGPGNYSANAPIPQSGGGLFGSISAGAQPYLGGSPMALDAYLQGINRQQGGLQTAATNALLEPVAAPQADYSGSNQSMGAAGLQALYSQARAGQLATQGGQYTQQGMQQANALAAQGAGAYQQNQQALGQMQQATNLARSAALGQQPSQAELQQSQGVAQAQRGNLAAAASVRGGAAQQAAALQQAQMNNSNLGNLGIAGNAQLRAGEMATNRAQYLGATQAQAQGAGALANLSLAQQQQAAQQGLGYGGLSLQQQQAAVQQGLGYGSQALQTAQQQAQQAQFQAQLNQAQTEQNRQYSLGVGQQALGYGQLGLSAQQSQLAAGTAYGGQQVQAEQAANQANTQFATGVAGGIGGLLGGIFSDVKNKQQVQPVASAQPAQASQVAPATATAVNPQGSIMGAQTPTPQAPPVYGMTRDEAMAFLKGQPAPAPTVAQAAPRPSADAVVSDKETKAGAHDATHVADAYLDELAKSASTYSYKDPSQAPAQRPPGARFGGVMAQDLEQVPEIGHQLVDNTPRGKALEGGANLSAALMGLGRLHQRLKELEARGAR